MRPCTPQQIVREAIYAFAAIAPKQGQMTSLILPSADTDMMTLFLEHVSTEFADAFMVMQVDGAGWHHSQELHLPENIRLIASRPHTAQNSTRWSICGRNYARNTSPIGSSPHWMLFRSTFVRA
jgi:hypothetical protein